MSTNSTPQIPQSSPNVARPQAIKPATPDLIIAPADTVPIEIMTDLIFEDIGGHEIITISRSDLINGENVIYSPIKNLSSIFFQYNPQNILALQKTADSYFKNFPIKLGDRIPECGTGYTLDESDPTKQIANCKIVYTDPITGDIVINVINMGKEEQVEVQILQQGIILSDTIYGVE
jgi:hypothetical protein